MKRKPMSSPRTQFKLQSTLLISPVAEDHDIFDNLFRLQGWTLRHADSIRSAPLVLKESPASVIITERDLPIGSWKDVLDIALAMPVPPLLIVVSQLADERLWAEALNLGAYDVLAKPLDSSEVVRVLSLALNYRYERPAAPSSSAMPAV